MNPSFRETAKELAYQLAEGRKGKRYYWLQILAWLGHRYHIAWDVFVK